MALNNQAADLACPLTVGRLVEILSSEGLNAELVHGDSGLMIERVAIDSRAVSGNLTPTIFVALAGARVDGHQFIESIIHIVGALVVRSGWATLQGRTLLATLATPVIEVADPLRALQVWARHWRVTGTRATRIGITGSSGKTTTKAMAAAVLATRYETFETAGNLNSVIGLPLALLAMPATTEVAVLEMAMSEAGEMAVLAELVEPDIAIITGIGTAHLANLGSREAIAREKRRIAQNFTGQQLLLIPENDFFAPQLGQGVNGLVRKFGQRSTEGFEGWHVGAGGQGIKLSGHEFWLPLFGEPIRSDALAVVEAARKVGLSDEEICRGFANFQAPDGRGQVLSGRFTLVVDCYNANPESMAASIQAFMERPATGRRFLVLGDMLELGTETVPAHEAVGRLAAGLKIDGAFFFGPAMADAYRSAQAAQPRLVTHHTTAFDDLVKQLEKTLRSGDSLLLKASRGMALERLVPHLSDSGSGRLLHA